MIKKELLLENFNCRVLTDKNRKEERFVSIQEILKLIPDTNGFTPQKIKNTLVAAGCKQLSKPKYIKGIGTQRVFSYTINEIEERYERKYNRS